MNESESALWQALQETYMYYIFTFAECWEQWLSALAARWNNLGSFKNKNAFCLERFWCNGRWWWQWWGDREWRLRLFLKLCRWTARRTTAVDYRTKILPNWRALENGLQVSVDPFSFLEAVQSHRNCRIGFLRLPLYSIVFSVGHDMKIIGKRCLRNFFLNQFLNFWKS